MALSHKPYFKHFYFLSTIVLVLLVITCLEDNFIVKTENYDRGTTRFKILFIFPNSNSLGKCKILRGGSKDADI